ncbi:YdeI/OmpD-associated family protein [Rhodanobacter hydrolyticus]|uniref:YdeI/OmpD-associated family protein n=1 Tax=Rhodanobacter hydrolyticus TaxID=2250595 RepID=A0ABW8JAB1_9GAMM
MANQDPRIDAYIAKSAEFARPILEYLRAVVHSACPEVEEAIKWGMPFFVYRDAPLCMMASFKQHCGFGFWLSKQVTGSDAEDGMGQFGKLASTKDLPAKKTLIALIGKAMALNEAGVKSARAKAGTKPPLTPPEDFIALLAQRKHAAARKTWEAFPDGCKREYIAWIVEAKTDATRQKRLATTLEWLAEGKRRNWKYEK